EGREPRRRAPPQGPPRGARLAGRPHPRGGPPASPRDQRGPRRARRRRRPLARRPLRLDPHEPRARPERPGLRGLRLPRPRHRALRRERKDEMTGRAGALILLLVALAPGCASAPDRLKDLHSADQDDRINAAIAISNAFVAGERPYVERRKEISTELRRLLD